MFRTKTTDLVKTKAETFILHNPDSESERFHPGTHTGSGAYNWGSFLKMCCTSFKLTVASGAHIPVLSPSDKMTVGI